MKRFPVWCIVVWSIMAVVGLAWCIVAAAIHAGPVLQWILSGSLWLSAAMWILLYILTHPRKKAPAKTLLAGNRLALQQRIDRETDEAVARYLGAVTRRGLFKGSALYERPWFLACGAKKAGKTSLLRGSGLPFPLRYPSEKDGLQLEGADQTNWYFSNDSVWIDTPGAFMDDANSESWQALVASLYRVRPENPVDGIALVVNAREVLDADDRQVKEMAKMLRGRIDELIAAWGIEFPVYLIFNHSDEIPGFNEYFNDQHARGSDHIFGATLPQQDKTMPRLAFAEEFRLLSKSLTDLRLDKLVKEKDEPNRRMICRFVIHFEGMQEKMGAFVTELFKPSSYEGRPIFRGFYFTSCVAKPTAEKQEKADVSDVGMTIVSHPMNPNKIRELSHQAKPQTATQEKKPDIHSLFVLPLFREIMVRGKELVKNTQKRTRKELLQHYGITLAIVAAIAGLCLFMFSGDHGARDVYASVQAELAKSRGDQSSLLDQYRELEIVGSNVARLQRTEDRGAPWSMGLFGFYQGKRVLGELNKLYFDAMRRLIVAPAVKYLEYKMWESAQQYANLGGEQYNELYTALKAYLSMSEAMADHPKDIDTTFMRQALLDAIKQSLLSQYQQQRLPEQVEIILQQNMGMYLLYVKRLQFPPVQENQRLVMAAREKLRRLPDAQTLYESVVSKFIDQAPRISLDQMLSRKEEGILKSDKQISALYTQEGWDKFVSDGISQISKDPFKLDWVLGLAKDQAPDVAVDTRKLYDDMIAAYLVDFKGQWLTFLSSIHTDPLGDLPRCSRIMQMLTADKSELAVLLETVSNYTIMKKDNMAEKAGAMALEAASQLKATKNLAKKAEKAESAAEGFSLGRRSPFDDLAATFDPLRSFSRSTGGALSGYEGYKDKIKTLVEKLNTLASQGDEYALVIFNGKDDDPLLSGWKFSQNFLAGMPEDLAKSVRALFIGPLEYTGAAASKVLGKTLNARWHAEIIKPYTSRFSGRYPFATRGEDASFSDVMDFFRCNTGTFWGFYERVLSPFVVKTSTGWMVRTLGSLKLNFNPKLSTSLISAERIRDIFFKPDGTLRTLGVTFTPMASNKNTAKLEVNGQIYELPPGGRSVQVNWPVEAHPLGASLKVFTSADFSEDITFTGWWGLMKLVQAARVNKVNSSTFSAKWQVTVQNMYVINQDYRIQVSGTDHPFGDPMFQQFDCPTDLILPDVAADKAAQPAAPASSVAPTSTPAPAPQTTGQGNN